MKKDVGKRAMKLTRETIRELAKLDEVAGGLTPVSSKPCSDGTCYKWTGVCQ